MWGETSWLEVLFPPLCLQLWNGNYAAFLTFEDNMGDNGLKLSGAEIFSQKDWYNFLEVAENVIIYCSSLLHEGVFLNHHGRFFIVKASYKHDCKTCLKPKEKDITVALIKDKLANASYFFSGGLSVSKSVSDNPIDSCWWFLCLSWNIDIIKETIKFINLLYISIA